jgi:hypothetical protein
MAPLTGYALEQVLAPGLREFDKAEIPDASRIGAHPERWASTFVLNSVGRGRYVQPMQTYVFNFLRRGRQAFAEHAQARELTIAFLEGNRQSPPKYVDALFHWESFVGQAWHAYQLLYKPLKIKLFDKGDGSQLQRLNAVYNAMKHVESRIENGQILDGATVPVWLTNEGLRSVDCLFAYSETFEILEEIAKWGTALVDPVTAGDVIRQWPQNG